MEDKPLVTYRNNPSSAMNIFKHWSSWIGVIVVLIITFLIMVEPLFDKAFNPGGDIYIALGYDSSFHNSRIESIYNGLLAGEFPVYMYSYQSDGYNYPLGIMYPDLFLYPFAFLRLLGIKLATCSKLLISFICLITIALSFISARMLTKNKWIIACFAVIYSLAPYHIINIYGRFAIGECLATSFLPLIVSSLLCMYYSSKKKNYYWIPFSLGFAGVVYSHILTFVLVFCVCVILVLVLSISTKTIPFKSFILSLCFTVLLSLAFIVPFIDYYFNYECYQKSIEWTVKFLNDPASLYPMTELLSFISFPNFGDSGMVAIWVGWVYLLALIVWPVIFIIKKIKKSKVKFSAFYWSCWLLSVVFILMIWKKFPWDYLLNNSSFSFITIFASKFQFASRFLNMSILFACFLFLAEICLVPTVFKKQKNASVSFTIIAIVICFTLCVSLCYIKSFNILHNVRKSSDTYFVDTLYCPSEFITDSDAVKKFNQKNLSFEEKYTGQNWEGIEFSQEGSHVLVNVKEPSNINREINLPLIAYPYVCAVDEYHNSLPTYKEKNSTVVLDIPSNYSGSITVGLQVPWYWTLSKILSLIAFLAIFFCGLKNCGIFIINKYRLRQCIT